MTLAGKAPVKKFLLGSLDVFLRKQQPGLRIDAVEAQFVGRDAQSGQKAQLTANVTSTVLMDVVYLGSKTRDTVNIQTRGRAVIHAGSGDDVVMAKVGQRSEIKGNDGNDTIMVQGPSASVTYEGGKGRDTFDIPNPKAAEQIIDFDPSTDVDRSEVE